VSGVGHLIAACQPELQSDIHRQEKFL